MSGDDGEGVHAMLRDAAGDLWKDVEIVEEGSNPATSSPIDTPLWKALTKVSQRLVPGATTLPFLIVGATDARFFRRKGVVAYGYGLLSDKIPFGEFSTLFHGNNERIDQESLGLMTPMWEGLVREMVG
jgi:acetylornithine deacetylase/succinyl-diaminopimelate desuccinylase-like protein